MGMMRGPGPVTRGCWLVEESILTPLAPRDLGGEEWGVHAIKHVQAASDEVYKGMLRGHVKFGIRANITNVFIS